MDLIDDSDVDVRFWVDFNVFYGLDVFGVNFYFFGIVQWFDDLGDGLGLSYDVVGKVFFGDIDIVEDQCSLWVVNFVDCQFYNIFFGSFINLMLLVSVVVIG